MNKEVVEYIKKSMDDGFSVPAIIAELQKSGHTEADIDAGFRHASHSKSEPTPRKATLEHNQDATKVFTVIGGVLVVVAILIVIITQWDSAGSLGHILFSGIPTFLLLGLAFYYWETNTYKVLRDGSLITGCILFPFFVGVLLSELSLFSDNTQLFFLTIFLASSALTALLEFSGRKPILSILTLISAYGLAINIFEFFDTSFTTNLWHFLTIFSIAISALGIYLLKKKHQSADTYAAAGIVLTAASIPASVFAILTGGDWGVTSATFVYTTAILGLLYLYGSVLLYKLNQHFHSHGIHSAKRLIEEVAVFMVLIPFVAEGINDGLYAILALILCFAAIILSIPIRLRALFPMGLVGVVVSIICIGTQYFANSISWPLAVLLAGFAMFGIGYAIRSVKEKGKLLFKNFRYFGLGESPHEEKLAQQQFSCVRVLLFLLAIPFILAFIFRLMYFSF